jgi:alkylated DNA repair dioxygenase AlkB
MHKKDIISIPDNFNILYEPQFLTKYKADKYFFIFERDLVYDTDNKVTVNGKEFELKRKHASFADLDNISIADNMENTRNWNGSDNICIIIRNIHKQVEKLSGKKFNFVLINRYADGSEGIGAHRDGEEELGEEPTIIGVSLGAYRDIVFSPYFFKPVEINKRTKIELMHGSLFSINHPTNTFWKHEIPKQMKVKSARISLTFRFIYS